MSCKELVQRHDLRFDGAVQTQATNPVSIVGSNRLALSSWPSATWPAPALHISCFEKIQVVHFPLLPIGSSKPFNCLLQNPFRSQDAPSLSPSIHCTGKSPTTVKGLLSAGTAQALELREWILYQYSHDLVILCHELMLLGLFCINFPQLDSLAPSGSRLSVTER